MALALEFLFNFKVLIITGILRALFVAERLSGPKRL